MKNGWTKVPLDDVLKRSEAIAEIDPTGRYRQVTVRLWGQGVVQRDEVDGSQIVSGRRFLVHAGQFILSRIDARNGAFGLVPEELDGAVVSNDFPVFDTDGRRMLPEYLGWLSRTRDFVELCKAASEGTTNRVRLKEGRFLSFDIPLPPLDEQRRIVAKLDQLAAKIEEVQLHHRGISNLTRALIAAVLARMIEELGPMSSLAEVLSAKPRNGWSARCSNAVDGVPVLTLSAVTGYNFQDAAYKRTSLPTDPNAHYWLQRGDLLITRSNTPELVGHAAIYQGNPSPCIYPDLMMKVSVNPDKAHTRFVWYWLQSPIVRKHIEQHAKGTSSTMKKISQGVVMDIPFPASLNLARQAELTRRLDSLHLSLARLEGLQSATAKVNDALLPSILDSAFRGEL